MFAVLTSGVALGVHVPGLLLARRLRAAGRTVRVDVLERLLPQSVRDRIPQSKAAFHRDFGVAIAGQRLARRNATLPGPDAVTAMRAAWRSDGADHLIVLSGFWLPAALGYAAEHPGVRVQSCHVDSVASPSFTTVTPAAAPDRTVHSEAWLLQERDGGIARTIRVSSAEPVPWPARVPRFLVHGGGWGMGTYARHAADLSARGLALDVVVYEAADLTGRIDGNRYFMIDPGWQPWHDEGFPPFGEVAGDGTVDYRRGDEHHDSFHLARTSLAMISKPGGGTLMDSLSAATPVVLLEPFGAHEARNAELWQRLGFGISLAGWAACDYSPEPLARLHRNLLAARRRADDYRDLLLT
jgi:hypothetical protein